MILLVAALTARGAAVAWTDYLWFSSLDFAGVWRTLVFTRIFLVIIATVIAFLVIYLNLRLADRLSPRRAIFALGQSDEVIARFQGWAEIYGGRILLAAAGVFGFLIGLTAGNAWERVLLFLNRTDFGTTDAVFGKDIGFFVFTVPFYRDVFAWGFQLLIWTTLLVAVLHYLNGGIQIQQNLQRVSPAVKLHLSILFAGLAIFKAIGYWLDRYELLYSTRGAAFGATYTDLYRSEAGSSVARRHFAGGRHPDAREHPVPGLDASAGGRRTVARDLGDRRWHHPGRGAAPVGRTERDRKRDAVHRAQHRRNPRRLRPEQHHGHGLRSLARPGCRGHRSQPCHGRQHPPVGSGRA